MLHSANGIKREVQSFNTVVLSLYLLFRFHNNSSIFLLILNSWSLQIVLFQNLLHLRIFLFRNRIRSALSFEWPWRGMAAHRRLVLSGQTWEKKNKRSTGEYKYSRYWY